MKMPWANTMVSAGARIPKGSQMKSRVLAFVCCLLAVLAISCAGSVDSSSEGGEGEPCYSDGTCDAGLVCNDSDHCMQETVDPSCDDGEKNGQETDVDCGGGDCGPCGLGKACVENSDCESTHCENEVCVGGDTELSISFIAPTDVDGAVVDRNWTAVAVAVSGTGPLSSFIDFDHSLVGYFNFDEGLGEAALDSSSYGHDGVLENDPQWVSGKFGGALAFDGVDDRVVIENDVSLGTTGPLTVEVWINPAQAQELCEGDGSNNGVLAKCDRDAPGDGNHCSWQLRYGAPEGCRLGFMFKTAASEFSWVTVGSDLAPGQWHHVAGVFDGTSIKSYLDGVETDSAPISGYLASNARLLVGEGGYATFFEGSIDEVRIQSRALSAEELLASYSAGFSLTRRFEGLASGQHHYQALVVDSEGSLASTESRVLNVDIFAITTTSLPSGLVDTPYSATIEVSGGQPPYAWAVDAGELPAGLTLGTEGQIVGTPTSPGDFSFVVQVDDNAGRVGSQALEIGVREAVVSEYVPTYFVDATNGDDGYTGTTEDRAWKTLAKVGAMSFSPGDVIAFKRGETFPGSLWVSDSGTSGNPITLTAYGTGERPILTGVTTIAGTWTQVETNKWRMARGRATRLHLDGVEQMTIGTETTGEPHWEEFGSDAYNGVYIWYNNYLYYYSTANPSTLGLMTASTGATGLTIAGRYIDVVELNIMGYFNYPIYANAGSDYCTIRNNTIGLRSGHGIKTQGVTGWLIERNSIDSGLRIDYTGFDNSYRGASNRGCYDGFINYGGFVGGEIRYNDFVGWGHAAFSLVSSGELSNNNIIHHNEFTSPGAAYSRAFAWSGSQVRDNEAHNNYIHNMSVRGQINGVNNNVHHNWFSDFTRSLMKLDEIGQAIGMEAYNGAVSGNVFAYNTISNIESPGFEFVAATSSVARVYGNVLNKNLFDNCGTSPYRPSGAGIGLNVQNYTDIGQQTFTDNAFINSSTGKAIRFNDASLTPDEFNAQNGVEGNTISGNSSTVTDQGAGILDVTKVGVNGIE